MKNGATPKPSTEVLIAAALNEQGYLLQQKVVDVLKEVSTSDHHWYVESSEIPVSLPDGQETRIDLVL